LVNVFVPPVQVAVATTVPEVLVSPHVVAASLMLALLPLTVAFQAAVTELTVKFCPAVGAVMLTMTSGTSISTVKARVAAKLVLPALSLTITLSVYEP
jgi:hypothetical protein